MLTPSITILQVTKEMDKFDPQGRPVPFSLTAVTCSRAKNTGGEILVLENVVQARNLKLLPRHAKKLVVAKREIPVALHNRIRRLYILSSGEIRNVNLRLITHFNNQRIIY